MTEQEILRRLRQLAIGYMILAVTILAGLAYDWNQTHDIRDTQSALVHDTEALARAIANGQTYLCNQISFLSGEVPQSATQTVQIHCFTQQQRYRQILHSLESH